MASIEKRTRAGRVRWLARWRDGDGAQRTKSFTKRAEAETYLASVTVSLAAGDYIDPRAGRVSFLDYYEDFARRQVWRPGTRKAMDLAARKVPFGHLPLGRISRSHIQFWVKQLSETLEAGTVRTRFANVRRVFRSAVDDRLIRIDPTTGVSLPKPATTETRMRILSTDESRSLFGAAKPEFRAFLGLGLLAGLRMGEVAGLQIGDIDFLRRRVSVRRQVQRVTGGVQVVPPKTRASTRTIPVPDELVELLAAHVALLPDREPARFLFETRGCRPTDQNVAGTAFRRTCQRAGVQGVTFHDLRHTYASALIAGGADVVKVQHALGHGSANVTLGTYAHLWPDSEDVTRAITSRFAQAVVPGVCNHGVAPNALMASDLRV